MNQYGKSVGGGRKAIIGIMGSESKRRAGMLNKSTSCFTKSGHFYPIHDLTADMRNRIEKYYGIEVPKIYDYVDQTGCVGCPYGIYKFDATNVNFALNLQSESRRNFILEYFKESYAVKDTHLLRCLI